MKKTTLLFLLIIPYISFAQPFKSKTYKTGNYIFCGNELPKHFSYVIERRFEDASPWITIAELHAPKNEAECEASLLSLPAVMASLTSIDKAQTAKLWRLIQKANVVDSMYAYGYDPRFQTVVGSAWFDEGINKAGTYQYRIYRLSKSGERTLLNETKISYPGIAYFGTAIPVNFKINENNINIAYALNDSINTAGLKIYRSIYKQKQYKEIPVTAIFTHIKGKISALITDASVAKGVTYSYVAIPYDALGNMGKQNADTLNIYNMTKASDIGLIETFDAIPEVEKRGVLLKWTLKNSLSVTSVDIYRSATYDGQYVKIASVAKDQKEFFDNNKLRPATAFYYYILINSGYGNSLPSARIPAILKGNKQNFFPPQNLTISRKGRIVTLSFKRLGNDIHGYYIYRANGYVADLIQLPRMLLSKDSMLTYNDTLSLTAEPVVFSYAVASVNSSYSISPLTERVSMKYSGGMLPVPAKVNATAQEYSVLLTWNDAAEQNAAVSAYQIFRTTVDENDKSGTFIRIATNNYEQNHFTDTTVADGTHYRYSIRCIGIDAADTGSMSMPVGIALSEQLPLQPGSISAFATDKKIIVQWDAASDNSITDYRIYRAIAGEKPSILKQLAADAIQFEDTTVKPKQTYFYFITSVSKSGKESKPTDEVSAMLK